MVGRCCGGGGEMSVSSCSCLSSQCPASTRKLYEKKLQELLDSAHAPSEALLVDAKATANGSADPELYSDQDDGEPLFPPDNLLVNIQRSGTAKKKKKKTRKPWGFKAPILYKNSWPIILLVPSSLEVTETQPESAAAPELPPVAERPPQSRGKGPPAAHSQSVPHTMVGNARLGALGGATARGASASSPVLWWGTG